METTKIDTKNIDIQDLSSVKKKIRVCLEAETVKGKMETAFNQVQRKAKIKGFRQGKAPMAIVRKEFLQDVEKEVVSDLISSSLNHVFNKHDLHPVTYPVLEEKNFKDEGDFEFCVTLEVKPEITAANYRELTLEKDVSKPGKEQIDNVVKRLQEQHAILKEKKATSAQKGDYVAISIDVLVDGKPYEKAKVSHQTAPLGENQLLPELEEALPSMKVGESRDAEVTFPKEHRDENLAGKKVVFHLTLEGIKERIMPKVDDEFAKTAGSESLKALQDKIKQSLIEEAEKMEKQNLEKAAIQQILEANPFEVPPTLVRERAAHLLRQWANMGYRAEKDDEAEKIEKICYESALEEVRTDLVMEAIAEQEKITVEEVEVDQRIDELVQANTSGGNGKKAAEVRQYFDTPETRSNIRFQLESRKTLDLIMSSATIKEKSKK